MPTLQVITLGCSKNTVDTEHLLFQVRDAYEIVPEGEVRPVDVLLINTCGFIGDAKEQSIQVILEAAQRKKERIILEVIVQGFEYDRIYSEREVNIIIADFYDDFCTIRRDMIGEGLMDRDTRGYWRVKQ